MIAIIDYKAGNLASVSNALHRIGAAHAITNRIDELEAADHKLTSFRRETPLGVGQGDRDPRLTTA